MDNFIDITEAINSLRPNAEYINRAGVIEWLDTTTTQPTEEEIQAEILRLQDEYTSLEYSRLREAEYAKLNQDEMRFDDRENGTDTWYEAIIAIKAQYPKPI